MSLKGELSSKNVMDYGGNRITIESLRVDGSDEKREGYA